MGMVQGRPDISIVIVSWNVSDYLRRCLESVFATKGDLGVEVEVVDNNSNDGSADMVAELFPQVRLTRSSENLGFARANNLAFGRANGRYVFILNPDTVMHERTLEGLVRYMDDHPAVGMIGPKTLLGDGTTQKSCARRLPGLPAVLVCDALRLTRVPGLGGTIERLLQHPYDYDRAQEVEAISGAAMFVRTGLLNRLNGFETFYFHTGEDIDLCFRFRGKGEHIWYVPDVALTHFGGRSSSQDAVAINRKAFLSYRRYFEACHGRGSALGFDMIVKGISIPVGCCLALLKYLSGRLGRDDLVAVFAIARAVCLSNGQRQQ